MKTKKIEIEKEININKKSFRSYKVDMNFGELMSLYMSDKMQISPYYQRLFHWDVSQRTQFMESLLLGIPIPPIFVFEDENGKWEVVDGFKRLFTFFSFVGCLNEENKSFELQNNWKMKSGEIIKTINALSYNDLPMKIQLSLKRTFCGVIVIQADKEDYHTRFEIIKRLNKTCR